MVKRSIGQKVSQKVKRFLGQSKAQKVINLDIEKKTKNTFLTKLSGSAWPAHPQLVIFFRDILERSRLYGFFLLCKILGLSQIGAINIFSRW